MGFHLGKRIFFGHRSVNTIIDGIRPPTGFSCWKFILLKRAWYPKQAFFGRMFDKTTVFYVMIWSHPTETTVKKLFFGVPGGSIQRIFVFHPPKKWQVGCVSPPNCG